MKPNLLPFIREKWNGVSDPAADFAGQTVLVTGANVGLGFEATAKFVSLGAAKVILASRNISKGNAAQRLIEQRIGRQGVVEVWQLDMGRYASIQSFASRANEQLPRLDVVVLNAGVSPKDYVLGVEGWESILQVNVLGTALLGLLLLPKLNATSRIPGLTDPPNLVIVTSEAHRWLEPKDLPDTGSFDGNLLKAVNAKPVAGRTWDGMLQNARSKLFAMYVTKGLTDLVTAETRQTHVVVSSVCPGACKSDLVRDFKAAGIGYSAALKVFDILFNKTTEQGARVYVSAASLGTEAHGLWYKTTAITPPGDLVSSEQGRKLQQQVWAEILDSLAEARVYPGNDTGRS